MRWHAPASGQHIAFQLNAHNRYMDAVQHNPSPLLDLSHQEDYDGVKVINPFFADEEKVNQHFK